jgi:hypothetical protein
MPSPPAGSVPVVNWTVREPSNGSYTYWQVIRATPPQSAASPYLKVWFRAWAGGGPGTGASTTTRPEYSVAWFRQGSFSDYQLLMNGPIHFESNFALDGKVHSNGVGVGSGSPAIDMAAGGGASGTCANTTRLSTANGTINMPASCTHDSSGAVSSKPNTGAPIDFLRAHETFSAIASNCGHRSRCFGPLADPNAQYRAQLGPSTVTVSATDNSITPSVVPVTSTGMGLIFGSDVRVQGVTSRDITIAASRDWYVSGQANPPAGAADVIIEGNVGTPTGSADATGRYSLGLIAQGNVVLASCGQAVPGTGRRLLDVHAALIAAGGTLTLDPGVLAQAPDSTATVPQRCDQLNMTGPVSAQTMPVVSQSGNGVTVGYPQRTYSADYLASDPTQLHFSQNPPPYFPLTGKWETANVKRANMDCLGSSTCD